MTSNPPPDTMLRAITGTERPLSHYLTQFHLVLAVVDPFTLESSWLLDTAARVLDTFGQADCRVAFLVAGTPDECRQFLGPHAQRFLTFSDPDREVIKALGLTELPALVDLGLDATVIDAAQGWRPLEWRRVADRLAQVLQWKAPAIPGPRDPAPFAGSPALG